MCACSAHTGRLLLSVPEKKKLVVTDDENLFLARIKLEVSVFSFL
jgi:hypothetical protein